MLNKFKHFDQSISDNRKHNFNNNPYFQDYFNNFSEDKPNLDKYNSKIVDDISEKNNIAVEFKHTNEMQETPIPSKLRVSTMTAICSIGMNLKLPILFDKIEVQDTSDNYPFIRTCQLGTDKIKGTVLKKKSKRKKDLQANGKPKRNYFQNQATLLIILNPERKVNLKIFRNGKIQMTGLKCKEEGIFACEKVICVIKELSKKYPEIIDADADDSNQIAEVKDINSTKISDFSIVLINSDFYGGFKIKREKLYEILFNLRYFVSYEPDIYPGVNAKYFWNTMTKGTSDAGICKCSTTCSGKGNGEGNGNCKKVTIATFQSGNIIITGARNNVQTMDAFNFINSILSKYYNNIVRILENDQEDLLMKKIKVKGVDILNLELRTNLISKIIK